MWGKQSGTPLDGPRSPASGRCLTPGCPAASIYIKSTGYCVDCSKKAAPSRGGGAPSPGPTTAATAPPATPPRWGALRQSREGPRDARGYPGSAAERPGTRTIAEAYSSLHKRETPEGSLCADSRGDVRGDGRADIGTKAPARVGFRDDCYDGPPVFNPRGAPPPQPTSVPTSMPSPVPPQAPLATPPKPSLAQLASATSATAQMRAGPGRGMGARGGRGAAARQEAADRAEAARAEALVE